MAEPTKIIGIMMVYNEADILRQSIEHLIAQGIELVIIDNGSTDGSNGIIREFVGKGVLSVQRLITERFNEPLLLERLQVMALEYAPDWMLLSSADEFLEPCYRGMTLKKT